MITTNLAALLVERKLKITKVSDDTGISRTTLTALSNGSSQGIQLETMNTLCQYLSITPEKLFLYVPFDIKVEVVQRKYDLFDVKLIISERGRQTPLMLSANVHADSIPYNIDDNVVYITRNISVFLVPFRYDVSIQTMHSIDEYDNQSKEAFGYMRRLPIQIRTDIEEEIVARIVEFYDTADDVDVYRDFSAIDLLSEKRAR